MEFQLNMLLLDGLISQPWHWAVSGLAIALTLFFLTWLGKTLSVSSSFEIMCRAAGLNKFSDYFNFKLSDHAWRIAFVAGIIIGGTISVSFFASPEPVKISEKTQEAIAEWGVAYPTTIEEGTGFVPTDLFNWGNITGILMAIGGGFLIGFGSRYARGCTSGHAITGLSYLQLPSLLSVIGFFIGGMIMTWLILPVIFS